MEFRAGLAHYKRIARTRRRESTGGSFRPAGAGRSCGRTNFTRIVHMGMSTGFENLERRIEEQFGLKRGIVLAVGIACLALGVLSIALPSVSTGL